MTRGGWSLGRLVLLLLLVAQGECRAEPHRLAVPSSEYPWSAIGRLNAAGFRARSHCTATLVAADLILTAAHCLWNSQQNDWWPVAALHFVLGDIGDPSALLSDVRSVRIAEGYRPADPIGSARRGQDWAIVTLEQPLGDQAGWLAVAPIGNVPRQAPIGMVGYRAESPLHPTLDYGCHWRDARTTPPDRLHIEDCVAAHGNSGGPVLAFLPSGPVVVAMVVMIDGNGGPAMTATIDIAGLPLPVHECQGPIAGGRIAPQPVETLHMLGRSVTAAPGASDMAALASALAEPR